MYIFIYIRRPLLSPCLSGAAPGTPEGGTGGSANESLSQAAAFGRHSCSAGVWPEVPPSNASRQPAGLLWPVRSLPLLFFWASEGNVREEACRKLFLWASKGDVRHPRAPPSNASRQPAGLPRPLCGLSEACLFSSSGLPKATLEKRHAESFFYGLPKATLDTHGPRPQTLLGSRQACPGLSVACLLFFWASEGNVREEARRKLFL